MHYVNAFRFWMRPSQLQHQVRSSESMSVTYPGRACLQHSVVFSVIKSQHNLEYIVFFYSFICLWRARRYVGSKANIVNQNAPWPWKNYMSIPLLILLAGSCSWEPAEKQEHPQTVGLGETQPNKTQCAQNAVSADLAATPQTKYGASNTELAKTCTNQKPTNDFLFNTCRYNFLLYLPPFCSYFNVKPSPF